MSLLFSLNLILVVFNLLPLPPLDGSGALPLLMHEQTARSYRAVVARVGFMGLFVAWKIFDPVFHPIFLAAVNLLYPGAGYH